LNRTEREEGENLEAGGAAAVSVVVKRVHEIGSGGCASRCHLFLLSRSLTDYNFNSFSYYCSNYPFIITYLSIFHFLLKIILILKF